MKKSINIALFSVIAATTFTASAEHNSIGKCIATVAKVNSGDVSKLEALDVAGTMVYELEVLGKNGVEVEYMCDAKTSKIIETETEAKSAHDIVFSSKAKVSEQDAVKTALAAYPGKVVELEYEIESDGTPTYEIDIMSKKGVETKVEVDAVSGKIIEESTELWEIGVEQDEAVN